MTGGWPSGLKRRLAKPFGGLSRHPLGSNPSPPVDAAAAVVAAAKHLYPNYAAVAEYDKRNGITPVPARWLCAALAEYDVQKESS